MSDPRAALKKVLLGEVGTKYPASGVTKYGSWFAQQVGDPDYRTGNSCAMGQIWAAAQVSPELLKLYGGIDKDWAWVPSWLKHLQAQGWEVEHAGELILAFLDFEPNRVPNHVVMAMGPAHGGTYPTVEFNTVPKPSGGPYGVWERERSVSQTLAFIRIPIPASLVDDSCWMG
jgi:hypothetical protein